MKARAIQEVLISVYEPLMGPILAIERSSQVAGILGPELRDLDKRPLAEIILSNILTARVEHTWRNYTQPPACPTFTDDEAMAAAQEAVLRLARAGHVEPVRVGGTLRNIIAYEIMKKRCNECLFTDAKIVGDSRKQEILRDCAKRSVHFVCHKATLAGWDVACRGFHEAAPGSTAAGRLAVRLNIVTEVSEAELEERKNNAEK